MYEVFCGFIHSRLWIHGIATAARNWKECKIFYRNFDLNFLLFLPSKATIGLQANLGWEPCFKSTVCGMLRIKSWCDDGSNRVTHWRYVDKGWRNCRNWRWRLVWKVYHTDQLSAGGALPLWATATVSRRSISTLGDVVTNTKDARSIIWHFIRQIQICASVKQVDYRVIRERLAQQ